MQCSTGRLIITLVLVILAVPLAAVQALAKVPRIGYLFPGVAESVVSKSRLEAFRQGLHEFGYIEGQNIAIESRFAGEREDQLVELAAELVQLNVDVIVANSTIAVRAVQRVTKTIPIVANSGDPVGTGVVGGLAHPGGNTTGVTSFSTELSGKRVELLKAVVPGLSRLAVLWNPTGPAPALAFKETEVAARALGLHLQSLEARSLDDLESAFEAAISEHAEALLIIQAPLTMLHRTRIVDFAARRRLPVMYPLREFAEAGGLIAYGPNPLVLSRRAAYFVDRILKGTTPADLPVEQPTKFELVINLKTASALGLTIPPVLLFQADEVIK